MKVRVDRDLCISLGNCVAIAPTVFAFDDEDKAIVLDPSSVDGKALLIFKQIIEEETNGQHPGSD